ncbi:MAG: curli assembly protein CsgF [Flavobacteriales bacterium]|nr:MAG: curli assembly protein CsgF [Flavobacteriales bacterium]
MKKLLFFILIALPLSLFSQELVYKPINPSFVGGNSFNAQWLLSSAESQNKLQEEDENSFKQQSELERFTESLNRQLLNSLSRDLFKGQFGDESFTEGTFTFGSLVVDIVPTSTGLSINVLDTTTGEQTQIIIPN